MSRTIELGFCTPYTLNIISKCLLEQAQLGSPAAGLSLEKVIEELVERATPKKKPAVPSFPDKSSESIQAACIERPGQR